ncbi:hypothetical protein CK203_098487 [Vitis vinifera]|uniref:Uncharacterized protein n=1 Tax=Vitis vinifera TaxID=29760 RepID=A0A438D163_VITVI|nr:hypothetical protein CK203_098487 [Vitis vinifera]
MAPLPGIEPESNGAIATAAARDESNGAVAGDGATLHCACHIEYEIAEEAMNFMSYVAEVSRGWDEPNARDMGRMTYGKEIGRARNEPDAEVQAISQTPLQAMPCAICLSYEHLVDECPTIPAEREMFGDCNTYNSNWRDHPNFSWKPQPPQYQQPAQAPQQASNLEQAMVNLCKVVGDFVRKQEAINAQINQRIDRACQPQQVQEKENSPSQPYQNSMSIHEMEARGRIFKKEIEEVITLRSGKEVDLPTCKLEHKVESETEKEKREEIKGKKKGKSIEKDGYDVNVQREPQRIVIKEELMKHMPPPFLQALGIAKKLKEVFRSKIGAKSESNGAKTGEKQGSARFRSLCEIGTLLETSSQPIALCENFRSCETNFGTRVPLRSTGAFRSCETHCEVKSLISHKSPFRRGFRSCESTFGTRVPLRSTGASFRSCETHCEVVKPDFAPKVPFRRVFRNCEAGFGTRVPFRSTVTSFRSCETAAKFQNVKNPNFTAAPPFRQLLDTFDHFRSSNYACNISFESLGSHESTASNGADLDLKRKSYGRLKMTVQTMTEILGSQESSASNGMQFGGEMKKLWSFEDKRAKLSENFAAETPFGRVFRSCETIFGTRVPFAA